MIDICCIGHITKDKIVTPRAEVFMNGGTSFYFASAIHRLPERVNFSLVTSMHPSDMQIVERFRKHGINVTMFPSRHTVFFENIYGENSDDRRQNVLAKADPFTIEQMKNIDATVYHLGSLLSDDFSVDLVEYLAQKGRVSIDAQGYLREVREGKVYAIDWKDKLRILKHTYYIKVNEVEMQTLTGLSDPYSAARKLHEWGVKEVCITLGSEGSLVFIDDSFYEVPAYSPKEVVDATGCGDTYSAGYLWSRQQGISPLESGKIAAAMCTIKLEHNGPFEGSFEEVEKIIESYEKA